MSSEAQSSTAGKDAVSVQIDALYADLEELEHLVAMLRTIYGPADREGGHLQT